MALEAIEVGGVVGVAYLLGEALKLAITKLGERKAVNGEVKLTKELYEVIKATGEASKAILDGNKTLLEMHGKTDDDGRPKWYFPSSMVTSQERTARAMERMGRVLDNLELRISNCPYHVAGPPPSGGSGPVRRPSSPGFDPVEDGG